ncbi:Aste57867_10056 [Aphanomyces stellatus]|uniref:Aste57867_10056 protein n=1 Tax=Aphanomyces stellatus TaxID=120398 RepID=A0A485KPX4_9STRA|nr:hypothetical protein As57867_010017 [Aphanomyces stellatus]VFT86932.1 Aste57867_10056 [Aphanomyces stellatus]
MPSLTTTLKEVAPLLPSTNVRAIGCPDESIPQHRLLGLFLVAISATTFSLMSCGIKYESAYVSSMEAMFWRGLGAWVLNLVAILITQTSVRIDTALVPVVAFRCVVGFGSTALAFWTISQLPLADASCIIFINPVLTFLLGALVLGEHLYLVDFCMALASFGGVVCVARPSFLFGATTTAWVGSPFAVAGGLLSASCQALAYVSLRQTKSIHFLVMIHYFMLSGVVGAALWLVVVETGFHIHQAPSVVWLVCSSTGLLGFLGQVCMTKGFQLEHAGLASMMRYLDIVFVFIWDAMLLKESINPWSICGAAIILSSAVAITVRTANRPTNVNGKSASPK